MKLILASLLVLPSFAFAANSSVCMVEIGTKLPDQFYLSTTCDGKAPEIEMLSRDTALQTAFTGKLRVLMMAGLKIVNCSSNYSCILARQ